MEFYAGLNKCTNGGNTYDHNWRRHACCRKCWWPDRTAVFPRAMTRRSHIPTEPFRRPTARLIPDATTWMVCVWAAAASAEHFRFGAPLLRKSWLKITMGPGKIQRRHATAVNEDLRVQRITVWECAWLPNRTLLTRDVDTQPVVGRLLDAKWSAHRSRPAFLPPAVGFLFFIAAVFLETGHAFSPIVLAWSHAGLRRIAMDRWVEIRGPSAGGVRRRVFGSH